MRIPEHRINEMRKNNSGDRKAIEEFFNSVFVSLDELVSNSDTTYDIPDNIKNYNPDLLTSYILSLLRTHLSNDEAEVVILSYGLNCDRISAKAIARKLGIRGNSAYVRVSQMKRQAIDKLINNVEYSQVVDFL
jgi:DNA-directed RNA polymerase specialized sigma subunit